MTSRTTPGDRDHQRVGQSRSGQRSVDLLTLLHGASTPRLLPRLVVSGPREDIPRRPDPHRAAALQQRLMYLESAQALAATVEAKDPYTRRHSAKVSEYTVGLARRMKLPAEELDSLRTAAMLHDIGKIGIPDAVLRKPGPLTPAEFELIKEHPAMAAGILRHTSFFERERPIVLHHHERFDGRGYPAGLAGEAIPLGARILCVADALDAMLSPRSYKRGYALATVRRELQRCAGHQFDPRIAELALAWLEDCPGNFLGNPTPR